MNEIFDGSTYKTFTGKLRNPVLIENRRVFMKARNEYVTRCLIESREWHEDRGIYPSVKKLIELFVEEKNVDISTTSIDLIIRKQGIKDDLQPTKPIDYVYKVQPITTAIERLRYAAW